MEEVAKETGKEEEEEIDEHFCSFETFKATTHETTSQGYRSLRQVVPCVLLPKQVAATRRLLGAHAVISYERECELVF